MGERLASTGVIAPHPPAAQAGGLLVHAALNAGLSESLLGEQRRILELVLAGESAEHCLVQVCLGVERLSPGLRLAIVVLDGAGDRIGRVVAPTLSSVVRALRGSPIGTWMEGWSDPRTGGGVEPAGASPLRATSAWSTLARAHGFQGGFAAPMHARDTRADAQGGASPVGAVFFALSGSREPTEDDRKIAVMAAGVGGLLGERLRRGSPPEAFATIAHDGLPALVSRAIEALPAAFYMTDASGRMVLYNRAAVELWGREPALGEQWCGSWKIFHPDGASIPVDQFPLAVALREKRAVVGDEIVVERPDGTRRHVVPHPRPLLDGEGRLTGAVNLLVDVTERRRSQDALRVSEERYRILAQATSSIVWTTDAKGRFVEPQPSWSQYTGQQWESLSRDGGRVVLHPEDRDRLRAEFEAACEARAPYRSLGRMWHAASGTYRRFDARGIPLLDAGGQVREWIGTCQDVEDRAQALEALVRNEKRYRAIVESQAEMLCRFRADGTILFVNGGYARARGLTPEALVGTNLWAFVHGADRERVGAMLAALTPESPLVRIENRVETSEGTRWTLWTNHALEFDAHGRPVEVQSTGIDITDHKQAEDALRESEERFRTLADNMSQFAWMTDATGWIWWYNQRWYDYTGTTLEQMRGWGWQAVHHPDHVQRVAEKFRGAIASGEPWEDSFPLRARDGTYRWFLSRALPIRDAQGNIVRWFGTNTDITERREIEEELARHKVDLEALVEQRTRELQETFDRLRVAERMAMMGTLSAGLGHDMGNLLLPLRIRLESLASQVSTDQGREDIEAIATASEYLRRLASGLRLLAIDPGRPSSSQATNLRAWWEEAEGVLRSVLPRGVSLESDLARNSGGELPDVSLSRAGLTQIVFNLVQNAGDATRERASGAVRISARATRERITLEVSDDGTGMTPEVRARCMEPFYTTKQRGISTGLGLALVYSLVREAGGEVELESQVGVGTTFRLHLPACQNAGTPGPQTAGKRAIVRVRDPRMRSFVAGELRAMGIATVDDPGRHAGQPAGDLLLVVDDPARLDDAPDRTCAICLGAAPAQQRAGVVCLPPNPGILRVRTALRDWARSDRSTRP